MDFRALVLNQCNRLSLFVTHDVFEVEYLGGQSSDLVGKLCHHCPHFLIDSLKNQGLVVLNLLDLSLILQNAGFSLIDLLLVFSDFVLDSVSVN